MTAKHFAIVAAAAALLTFVADACAVNAATAHAETCIKVDETNSPKATLSGRVVAHHQVPVAWKRDGIHAAATPFLRLDAPLLVDYGTGCQRLPDVALFVAGKPSPRMGQHVTITGTLNRFDSATVVPPVYLDARDAPKPGLLVPSLDHTAASIPEEFLGEWCAAKFENTDIFSRQCPVDGPVNSLSVLSDNFSINVTDCRVRDVKRSGRIYTLNAVCSRAAMPDASAVIVAYRERGGCDLLSGTELVVVNWGCNDAPAVQVSDENEYVFSDRVEVAAIVTPADWGRDGKLHPLAPCHLSSKGKVVGLACKG